MKTIKAPCKDKKTGELSKIDITGKVALLYVGNVRFKFLLREMHNGEIILTHYGSGYSLGSLTPVKLRYFKSYNSLKDREAAKILLSELVAKHGPEKVRSKLDSAPTIN